MADDHTLEEEQRTTPDELLDWLCWCFAMDGERFYPPDETAEECLEAFEGNDGDFDVDERRRGVEHGQHSRAYMTAVMFFEDLENWGYDPKARAEREIETSKDDGLELPDIDWEWYDDPGGVDG